MKNPLRILAALCGFALGLLSTGCTALIAAQQRAALPPGHVGEAKITVNVAGVGGGSLHVVNATKSADGTLTVAEYHSEINTAGGVVKVDLLDADLGPKNPPSQK